MDLDAKERWRGGEDRWRGGIDSDIRTLFQRVTKMDAGLESIEKDLHVLDLRVQTLATKIAIYAAIAAFLGSGLMSIIVGVVFRFRS